MFGVDWPPGFWSCREMNPQIPATRFRLGIIALALIAFLPLARSEALKTRNVFLIISDGLRWQEIFGGAEELLMTGSNGGVKNTNSLRAEFWRETPEARREALFPFIWTEVARRGQLFGNQKKGSVVTVTNGKNFSYPGYNEIFSGFGDPRIDSNDKKPNPNVTVFEWLNGRRGLKGRTLIFGSWDVFPYIVNCERSGLPIWPAWEKKFEKLEIEAPKAVVELRRDTTRHWEEVTYDSFLFHAAFEGIKRLKPRVAFIGFGETDEWAHAGRYDHYLTAAHHWDGFVRRLWEFAQSTPRYRDKTTFILTAAHGRGTGPTDWKSHGAKIEGSEEDWIAVFGPDTAALGERVNTTPRTQGQIAATIAALLGEDFQAAVPKAAPKLSDVVGSGQR